MTQDMTQEPVQEQETQRVSFREEAKIYIAIDSNMQSIIIWNPEVQEILTGIVATNGPILLQMPWDSVDLAINRVDPEEFEQFIQKVMQAEDYNPHTTAKLIR